MHLVGFIIRIYGAKIMNIIMLHIQQIQQIKMFTFVIVIVDDKVQTIKRCAMCQQL